MNESGRNSLIGIGIYRGKGSNKGVAKIRKMKKIKGEAGNKLKVDSKEMIYLLAIPFIMSFVFVFFRNQKDILALNLTNPQVWQYWTNAFYHATSSHFGYNLFGVLVTSFILYLALSKINEGIKVKYLLLAVSVFVPVLTALTTIHIFNKYFPSETASGASAIASALLGMSIYFLIYTSYKNENIRRYVSLFPLSLLVIAYFWIYSLKFDGLYLISLILILWIFYFVIRNKEIKKVGIWKDNITPLIIGGFSYFLFLILLFPTQIISESGKTDILAHYTGVVLGVVIATIATFFFKKT